jgi:hypothetical protein
MALAAVQALQSKLVACHGRHGSCHCCAVHAVTAAAFKVSTVCSVHSCAKLAHLTRVPLYRRYVDYLLGALSRRELFCWLSLSPSKFWHTLLLRDRFNYLGVVAEVPPALRSALVAAPARPTSEEVGGCVPAALGAHSQGRQGAGCSGSMGRVTAMGLLCNCAADPEARQP